MTLGEAIRTKRESLSLTQQELANKLFVSRQTVSRWESGARCPDLIMCKKISMVLGISLDDLTAGTDVTDYTPPKENTPDLSCVKVMLTGLMLVLIGTFLITADIDNMDISVLCFFLGIGIFVVGLFIPWSGSSAPVSSDDLPQRVCPHCGKSHDFDYPKCPFCGCDYTKAGGSHE